MNNVVGHIEHSLLLDSVTDSFTVYFFRDYFFKIKGRVHAVSLVTNPISPTFTIQNAESTISLSALVLINSSKTQVFLSLAR